MALFENGVPDTPEAAREASNLASALDALDPSAVPPAWEERLRRLRRAAECLERDHAGHEAVAARLGLGVPDLHGRLRSGDAFEEALRGFEFAFPCAHEGVSICAPDWREFLCGGFVRAAIELLGGHSMVLCSDERLPEIAQALQRSFLEAGFEPSTVGLIRGARREVLQTALADERVRALSASGSAERVIALRRISAGAPLDRTRLRTLRCVACEVPAEADIEAGARDVALRAFGTKTLGGQLPGQVARAFVPQKIYSRFVESLLECMGTIEELRGPVPLIDREAARRTQKAWIQGLDEGATMITGGEEEMTGDDLRLPPTVFCNVDAHMRVARRQEPLPVLCLLRST